MFHRYMTPMVSMTIMEMQPMMMSGAETLNPNMRRLTTKIGTRAMSNWTMASSTSVRYCS